jgi:hypothetical protein
MDGSTPLDGQIIPPGHQVPQPQPRMRSDADLVLDELGEDNGRIALTICDRLGSESLSLMRIAAEVRGWGDGTDYQRNKEAARQFYRWRVRSSALSRLYVRAMQSRAHVMAQELIDIVDSEPDAHRARVRFEARKWAISRFNRADFGDEPGNGVSVTINNDAQGSTALDVIKDRLARKRKSMLADQGGRAEGGGEGEGASYSQAPTLPSRT